MPQHLWEGGPRFRICEVCNQWQIGEGTAWTPERGSICPGDPDDAPPRVSRRRPLAPSGGTRVRELEPA